MRFRLGLGVGLSGCCGGWCSGYKDFVPTEHLKTKNIRSLGTASAWQKLLRNREMVRNSHFSVPTERGCVGGDHLLQRFCSYGTSQT